MANEDPPLSSLTKVKNKEPDKWPDGKSSQTDPNEEPDTETDIEYATDTIDNEASDQNTSDIHAFKNEGLISDLNKDKHNKADITNILISSSQSSATKTTQPQTVTLDTSSQRCDKNVPNSLNTISDYEPQPSTSEQTNAVEETAKRPSPKIEDWYSRTIRDDSREFESEFSDDEQRLKKSQSLSNLTRHTVDNYADPVYRWHRDRRTGRRRASTGDLFMAEEAGREVRVQCRCGAGRRFLKRLVRGGNTCERRLIMLHFLIDDKPESFMFCRDLPPEHLREALLGAAGASICDVVYLRNQHGALIGLSPDLETNTPSTAYRVFIQRNIKEADTDGEMGEGHRCVRPCTRPPPQTLTRQHIMCMGLLPNFQLEMEPICRQVYGGGRILDTRRPSEPHHHCVWHRFNSFPGVDVTPDEVSSMLTADVDCYNLTDEKILTLIVTMFVNLGFLEKFPIQESVLRNFLYEVYKHYNEVPFHNFRHSFCVAQMFYAIIMRGKDLPLDDITKLIIFVSCICHDLDHPGYNNIYQINARTDLAIRYNDISPLENHHCSVAFRILQFFDCNIFRNFSDEDFRFIREGMIRCILATDMARHNEILAQFVDITPPIIPSNKVNVNLLTMVLIKVADISNEVRPLRIAEPWLDRLLEEFFTQSDLEKRLGLPITPFMDREKVTKPTSQCAFIGLVLLPLFQALVNFYPELESLLITPAKDALAHYTALAEEMSPTTSQASNPMPSTSGIQATSRRDSVAVSGVSPRDTDGGPQSPGDKDPPGSPGSFAQQFYSETEVDVSEKALKFKIATEGSIDRRSYPSSRKTSSEMEQGSREAGLSNVDLIRAFHYASSPSPPPLEEDESRETETGQQEETKTARGMRGAASTSEGASSAVTVAGVGVDGTTVATPLVAKMADDTSGHDEIQVVTEQPTRANLLLQSSTFKTKGAKKLSPSKTSENTSTTAGTSLHSGFGYRSIISRLRVLTEKITFRDNSAPSSPSKDSKHKGSSGSSKEI